MTRPNRYLAWMIVGLLAVIVLAVMLFGRIRDAFLVNPGLNGGILIVLLIGIVFIFWQVGRLFPEIAWLESFRRGEVVSGGPKPRLLAPMAAMIGERKGRFSLSAPSLRSLLDGISARLDESRDISRYLIALMIFLGLLGTFWGLLGTINAVADAIGGLSVSTADPAALFSQLQAGLQAPLSGMGTAFSASLFGLAGSLVLGYLELQASQAQNRFYNELEDWLSAQTRLSSGGPMSDAGDQPVPAYIQALLEQTADSLESLQRTMARGEESRIQANNNLMALTDRLSTLTDQMRTEQQLMVRLAEAQSEMRPLLTRLSELAATGGFGLDEASRHHLRNVDVHMSRLIEELNIGRQYTVQELRSEIRLLARTIAALAEEGER